MNVLIRLRNMKNSIQTKLRLAIWRLEYPGRVEFGEGISSRDVLRMRLGPEGRVVIGDKAFFNNGCSINCMDCIEIGKNCLFGENVTFYDHNHRFSGEGPVAVQGYKNAPIKIGDNCWLGTNVVVLKGVTVGDGCVIGANVVLSQDVPPNSLVTQGRDVLVSPIVRK